MESTTQAANETAPGRSVGEPENNPFGLAEFRQRLANAQALMGRGRLDAMVLSSRVNVEYFSGYISEGWESPTRPFYIVLPREGTPIAVISSGIRAEWAQTSWITECVTWESPRDGDEGVRELQAVLADMPQEFGRVGVELGAESRIGMTLGDFRLFEQALAPREIWDCSWVCRDVRLIKSEAEIALVERAAIAACDAFDALPDNISPGASEIDAARAFKVLVHAAGADRLPFCAVASGVDGYDRFTSPATDRRLSAGEVFFMDVGAIVSGYSCDFNRNFAIGHATDVLRRRFEVLWNATQAGIAAVRPGNTAADVFAAQAGVVEAAGFERPKVGRLGHGLGKLLTEPPSNAPFDHTVLRPGMILTVEPFLVADGRVLVHEEDVVVTEDGARLLTRPSSPELPVIPWS